MKFQTNLEIAGSLRNSFRASLIKAQPYETVKAVLALLQEKGEEKSFLPILQADGAAASAPEYSKAQIQALKECGVTGYILHNAQGEYTLS